ncbi:MAG: hypothetical protein LBG27_07545 [Spirochaetaceae bacterium]|jgi:hypothetical protein|nr:hypothetical protein [Spirochaetaceae bacterium]
MPVFASCFSYPIDPQRFTNNIHYWDESVPKEESIELYIGQGLTVTSYNGIPVDWGKTPVVYLPPGEVVFTLELDFYAINNTTYSGNSIFVWNFKAGDRFWLVAMLQGMKQDGKPGIGLMNLDVKQKYEEYDFFPFPESGRRVLE